MQSHLSSDRLSTSSTELRNALAMFTYLWSTDAQSTIFVRWNCALESQGPWSTGGLSLLMCFLFSVVFCSSPCPVPLGCDHSHTIITISFPYDYRHLIPIRLLSCPFVPPSFSDHWMNRSVSHPVRVASPCLVWTCFEGRWPNLGVVRMNCVFTWADDWKHVLGSSKSSLQYRSSKSTDSPDI